jgi:hypothetical protein
MEQPGGRRRFLKSVGAPTFHALQAIKTRCLKRPDLLT